MTAKTGRVSLPRLFDAILRLLFMLALATSNDTATSAFVLGFSDAYWQVPLRDDERKFFCAAGKIKDKWKCLAIMRAAQCTTNAGLLWARLAAEVMRLSPSLYTREKLSLMCYVDDPLAALHGTERERQRNAALMILVWESLGFKLAYPKGQLGTEATWIGGTLIIEADGIRARVKESLIEDIKADLDRFLASNIISRKDLRSLVGKLGHAAGQLIIMKPFLEPLWAAIYSRPRFTTWG